MPRDSTVVEVVLVLIVGWGGAAVPWLVEHEAHAATSNRVEAASAKRLAGEERHASPPSFPSEMEPGPGSGEASKSVVGLVSLTV